MKNYSYVQNILVSSERKLNEKNKSNISSGSSVRVNSFLDGKELALVPWHQVALILDT